MYDAITGSAPLKTDLIELAVNRRKAAYWATRAMVLNQMIKEQAQLPEEKRNLDAINKLQRKLESQQRLSDVTALFLDSQKKVVWESINEDMKKYLGVSNKTAEKILSVENLEAPKEPAATKEAKPKEETKSVEKTEEPQHISYPLSQQLVVAIDPKAPGDPAKNLDAATNTTVVI